VEPLQSVSQPRFEGGTSPKKRYQLHAMFPFRFYRFPMADRHLMLIYFAYGWGVPLVLLTAATVTHHLPTEEQDFASSCWIDGTYVGLVTMNCTVDGRKIMKSVKKWP